MHSLIKKITSLLALLLVSIPFIFSVFSVVKLVIIKGQMSENLESEQLQTLTISKNDAKWVVPGKEILIDGNLFDIKSCRYIQNKLVITGLYDKEEDNLQDHIEKLFHQKENGNSTGNAALLNLFFQTLFIEKNTSFKTYITIRLLKNSNYAFTETLVSATSDILIPPPKAC